MDDKIYAYQLDANGVPQRCFITSNDAVIPKEYNSMWNEPLPVGCTIEGGKVIVPVVEVYTANDTWNWANDSLGNDYGHVHSGSESNGYSILGNGTWGLANDAGSNYTILSNNA